MSHLSPIPSSPFKQSRSTPIQSPRSNGVPIIQQSPYGFGPTSAMTLSTSPPVSDMFPQDVTHDDSQDNNRVFSDSYSTGTSPARNIGRDDGDFIGSPDPDDQNFVFVATSPGGPLQPDNALESTAVMKGNEDVGCSCEDCIIAGVGLDPVKRQLPRRCLVVFDDVQEGGKSEESYMYCYPPRLQSSTAMWLVYQAVASRDQCKNVFGNMAVVRIARFSKLKAAFIPLCEFAKPAPWPGDEKQREPSSVYIAITAPLHEPESVMLNTLQRMAQAVLFFHGPLENIRAAHPDKSDFSRVINEIGASTIAPLMWLDAGVLSRLLHPLPYTRLPHRGNRLFLRASQLLQELAEIPNNVAGCFFFDDTVLCTHLDIATTECILQRIKFLKHSRADGQHSKKALSSDFHTVYMNDSSVRAVNTQIEIESSRNYSPAPMKFKTPSRVSLNSALSSSVAMPSPISVAFRHSEANLSQSFTDISALEQSFSRHASMPDFGAIMEESKPLQRNQAGLVVLGLQILLSHEGAVAVLMHPDALYDPRHMRIIRKKVIKEIVPIEEGVASILAKANDPTSRSTNGVVHIGIGTSPPNQPFSGSATLPGSGLAAAISVAHFDPETHACDVISQNGLPLDETRAFHLAAAYAYQDMEEGDFSQVILRNHTGILLARREPLEKDIFSYMPMPRTTDYKEVSFATCISVLERTNKQP